MALGPIVQIMPKEKFTNGFIAFTRDAFPDSDIHFIVYGDDDAIGYRPISDARSVSISSKKLINHDVACRGLLKNADAIIINWVDSQVLYRVFPFIDKTYLFFWGGDLYPFLLRPSRDVAKYLIKRSIMRRAIARAAGILTLVPSDLDQVELLSKQHGSWHKVMMVGGTRAQVSELENQKRAPKRRQGTLRILLGNSATATNRHREAIAALSKFKNEDIAVYCPLSYGDAAYGDQIAELGRQQLGNKFIPLRDFIDAEKYDELLSTMDIGVFNHLRQQGLGNINRLMSNGAKVYVSRESVIWRDFKSEGRAFFATETIRDQTFEEFQEWDPESAAKNMRLLDPHVQFERGVALWEKTYEDITQ